MFAGYFFEGGETAKTNGTGCKECEKYKIEIHYLKEKIVDKEKAVELQKKIIEMLEGKKD